MSEREINICRLGLGLVLSMTCVLIYISFIVKLVSGIMGPSSQPNGGGTFVLVVALFLLFVDTIIVSGLYWLRWIYCLIHFLLVVGTAFLLPLLLPALVKCDFQSVVSGTLIVVEFILGPLASVLVVSSVHDNRRLGEDASGD